MHSKSSAADKHTLLKNAKNMQTQHANQAHLNDQGGSAFPKASIKKPKKQQRNNAKHAPWETKQQTQEHTTST